MHEYSKKICEHIKKVYGNPDKMNMTDLKELCEWTDILKDLTEYDINYRAIEAMDEYEDMEYGGRMGYRGRAKDGKFVHRMGRGRNAGYTPDYRMYPGDVYDGEYGGHPEMLGDYRMGYVDKMSSKYGNAYDKYDKYRKHYTETKDAESMKYMKESMNEWVEDVVDSAKDMWKTADANDKAVLKQRLTQLVQQMQ